MIKFLRSILTLILVFAYNIKYSLSASIYDRSSIISPPIGNDILPGGTAPITDSAKDSFLIANFIPFIIDYAIKAAVILTVVVLIFGGYQYLTAYGNTEKQDNARKTLTFALIGLVIAITAYGIITIITSIKLSTL